jgi:hypothetical protein
VVGYVVKVCAALWGLSELIGQINKVKAHRSPYLRDMLSR